MILKIVLVFAFVCTAQGNDESKSFGNMITLGDTGFRYMLGSTQIRTCFKQIKSDYEKTVNIFVGEMVGLSCETEKMFKETPETKQVPLKEKINSFVCSVKMYPIMSQIENKQLNKILIESTLDKTKAEIDAHDSKLSELLKELKDKTNSDFEKREKAEEAAQKYIDIREKAIAELQNIKTKFLICFYPRSKSP